MLLTTAAAPAAAAQVETDPCAPVDLASPRDAVRDADVIVIATLQLSDGGAASLVPEAYLKGPATGREIQLGERDAASCAPAALADRDRVIALLSTGADRHSAEWPGEGRAFVIAGGAATVEGESVPEAEVIEALREVTGVYAVPAGSEPGISFNIGGSILPVGLAIGAIFGIGLVLMRVWHRIDPS